MRGEEGKEEKRGEEKRGEEKRGGTEGCVVWGFDWEGDRGYMGVLTEPLIAVCAKVCVCV